MKHTLLAVFLHAKNEQPKKKIKMQILLIEVSTGAN